MANVAAWAFIIWRRPFEVGDRIQIGPHAGDVIDLGLFQFTLNEIGAWVNADQSSGRIIHVPNGKVFTDPVANYNKGFKYIWNEVPVVVTFESDWRKAKQILAKIAVKHAEHLTAQAEQELLTASRQYLINQTARHRARDLGRHTHRVRQLLGHRSCVPHGAGVQSLGRGETGAASPAGDAAPERPGGRRRVTPATAPTLRSA